VCDTDERHITYWQSKQDAAASRNKKGTINVVTVVLVDAETVEIADTSGKMYRLCSVDPVPGEIHTCVSEMALLFRVPSDELTDVPQSSFKKSLDVVDVDETRLKVCLNTISREDGKSSLEVVQKYGLRHFLERTPSELCVGQCVVISPATPRSSKLQQAPKLGMIRIETEGGFVVESVDGSIHTCPGADLVVCKNLDATKTSTQRDYLMSMSEVVGKDRSGEEKVWKAQAQVLLRAACVAAGHLPSMTAEIPAVWTNWRSFEGFVEWNREAIQQRMKNGLSEEDAGVMDLCTDFGSLLGQSMRAGAHTYGALLHKFYNIHAAQAIQAPSKHGDGELQFAPAGFQRLRGPSPSLVEMDSAWANVLDGDSRGFR
jgi:hypothetical protein